MNLIDASQLPQSRSDGPMTWGEQWTERATAQQHLDLNTTDLNADTRSLDAVYERRIKAIKDLTGQVLQNPLRMATDADKRRAAMLAAQAQGMSFAPSSLLMDDAYYQEKDADFRKMAEPLLSQYPQIAAVLSRPALDEVKTVRQDAKAQTAKAARGPDLGIIGNFSASFAGSIGAALRDPSQLGAMMLGGGPAGGKTVAAQIGRTILTESLLNGGQEALMQVAAQDRLKDAGLEYGFSEALKNVGIAALIGGLFGGVVEGGSALARAYRAGDGAAERATRILAGNPEPGDVEAFASDIGATISDADRATLTRSFEETALDDATFSPDAGPERKRVYEAAVRHAEDPDNFPEPGIVERMIAEEGQVEKRSLTADEYERIYAGDEDAIDSYRARLAADDGVTGVTAIRDPLEGERIRPAQEFEPADDAALARAQELAGELADPEMDANGRPVSMFDYIPFEDGNGNVTFVPVREALAAAEENDFLAELLEACKL